MYGCNMGSELDAKDVYKCKICDKDLEKPVKSKSGKCRACRTEEEGEKKRGDEEQEDEGEEEGEEEQEDEQEDEGEEESEGKPAVCMYLSVCRACACVRDLRVTPCERACV